MSTPASYRGLYGFVVRFPRLIIVVALLLAVASVVYTKKNMTFLTGRDQLMPANTSFNRYYQAYRQEFGDQEEIVVVIEASDTERAGRFGTRLYETFSQDRKHFREVFYPFGLEFFKKNGLLLVSLDEIRSLRRNLTLAKPALKELAANPSVETLFTFLTKEMEGYLAGDRNTPEAKEKLASLAFMLEKLGLGFQQFGKSGSTDFSLEEFFFNGPGGEASSFSKAGRQVRHPPV